MERADLRARWVYAIEAEDGIGVPPESMERAAALLNVGGSAFITALIVLFAVKVYKGMKDEAPAIAEAEKETENA